MSVRKRLTEKALGVGQKAVERFFADEQRAMKVAAAVGKVQQGKRALEKRQEGLMRALQLATRSDFKSVGKQLSGLKRRIRELEERLDALATERRP
ncbi:MAG: hypothetical protein L0Y66_02600 [Myxococcaceae bacterium]|nr:hypothetical protein [Myxococcaceae bacterium]MCI0669011.1 hypothetical protein [Myxococcaceae bacterium]